MKNYWIIADIHGEGEKFKRLLLEMSKSGFDLNDPSNVLVQLGDRNDRGPDSYEVNEWFKVHQVMYPGQVIVLRGNHDQMMVDAAEGRSDLMYYNGGMATARSYAKGLSLDSSVSADRLFPQAMRTSGHLDWLKHLPLYHETEEYFFCHAPIPKEVYRSIPPGADFRTDAHTLIWSYESGPEEMWVDPNPVPIAEDGNFYGKGKIAVYGHIHGMYSIRGKIVVPGARRYGNAILLDTGSGCHKDGYLSCLRLPDFLVMNSKGESKILKTQEEVEKIRAELIGIPDNKVDF